MDKDQTKIDEWNHDLSDKAPGEILSWAASEFGSKIKFASSLGLEDQVIVDMIAKLVSRVPVFTLDTGRLFEETYELIQRTEAKYNLKVEVYFPDAEEVEDMVSSHGVNLFRESVELRKMCCGIRKIHPLHRGLNGLDAWLCGLRRDQAISRTDIHVVEWDAGNGLIKINPLYNWSEGDVWKYIKEHDVPYNELHDQGFPSIGCSSCTRAVKPGEDVRAGRWWWEQPEQKECGLHFVDGKVVRGEG